MASSGIGAMKTIKKFARVVIALLWTQSMRGWYSPTINIYCSVWDRQHAANY